MENTTEEATEVKGATQVKAEDATQATTGPPTLDEMLAGKSSHPRRNGTSPPALTPSTARPHRVPPLRDRPRRPHAPSTARSLRRRFSELGIPPAPYVPSVLLQVRHCAAKKNPIGMADALCFLHSDGDARPPPGRLQGPGRSATARLVVLRSLARGEQHRLQRVALCVFRVGQESLRAVRAEATCPTRTGFAD